MVTSDLGRVTTFFRSFAVEDFVIVVTSDLGRVTTSILATRAFAVAIVVTSDLGRVTTTFRSFLAITATDCGDVRFRTSYN